MDKSSAKGVRDIKAEEKVAPEATQINLGNIPILTVRLLEAINKNLIVLVQQNAALMDKLNKE